VLHHSKNIFLVFVYFRKIMLKFSKETTIDLFLFSPRMKCSSYNPSMRAQWNGSGTNGSARRTGHASNEYTTRMKKPRKRESAFAISRWRQLLGYVQVITCSLLIAQRAHRSTAVDTRNLSIESNRSSRERTARYKITSATRFPARRTVSRLAGDFTRAIIWIRDYRRARWRRKYRSK